MIRPLKGCVLSNWMKTAQTIKFFLSLEGSGFQSLVMQVFMNLWTAMPTVFGGCIGSTAILSELREWKAAAQCNYLL